MFSASFFYFLYLIGTYASSIQAPLKIIYTVNYRFQLAPCMVADRAQIRLSQLGNFFSTLMSLHDGNDYYLYFKRF